MKTRVLCPAGEEVNPVLSPNKLDIQCRIQGGLRPARIQRAHDRTIAGSLAICCADYADCRIWQVHQDIERAKSTKAQRDQTVSRPHDHVIRSPNVTRTVR